MPLINPVTQISVPQTPLVELAPGIHRVDGFFPPGVVAIQTTRHGGVSLAPFNGLNLGGHVGDDPAVVARNRALLQGHCSADLVWLNQVHGVSVAEHGAEPCSADAIIARMPNQGCLIMTADCMPILVARPGAGRVAAIHAGWRGLCDGVIEATLNRLSSGQNSDSTKPADPSRNHGIQPIRPNPSVDSSPESQDSLWIWLGPAIGQAAFEVGNDVRDAFLAKSPDLAGGFAPKPGHPDKWLADLKFLALQRINAWFAKYSGTKRTANDVMGQANQNGEQGPSTLEGNPEPTVYVAQQNDCVFTNSDCYYSYRRNRITGRMASLIYLEAR